MSVFRATLRFIDSPAAVQYKICPVKEKILRVIASRESMEAKVCIIKQVTLAKKVSRSVRRLNDHLKVLLDQKLITRFKDRKMHKYNINQNLINSQWTLNEKNLHSVDKTSSDFRTKRPLIIDKDINRKDKYSVTERAESEKTPAQEMFSFFDQIPIFEEDYQPVENRTAEFEESSVLRETTGKENYWQPIDFRRKNKKPAPKDSQPKPKKTQLKDNFTPTNEHRVLAISTNIDIETELPKFIAYYQARGIALTNWDSAFKAWILKSVEFNQKGYGHGKRKESTKPEMSVWEYLNKPIWSVHPERDVTGNVDARFAS
jgi:hypothetical protein